MGSLLFGGLGPMDDRHDSQSGSYFEQAVEALRASGDPHVLWGDAPDWHKGSFLEPHQRLSDAFKRRFWQLKSSVLFTALSAEAYANEAVAELVTAAEATALDRLPAVDKLLLGPKVGGRDTGLHRGAEPIQTVQALFKVRDRLVHAKKSGGLAAFMLYATDADEEAFGPKAAVKYILAVADLMEAIDPLRPPPPLIFRPGRLLIQHRSVADKHLEAIGSKITDKIDQDGARPVSLLTLASRRAARARRTQP